MNVMNKLRGLFERTIFVEKKQIFISVVSISCIKQSLTIVIITSILIFKDILRIQDIYNYQHIYHINNTS